MKSQPKTQTVPSSGGQVISVINGNVVTCRMTLLELSNYATNDVGLPALSTTVAVATAPPSTVAAASVTRIRSRFDAVSVVLNAIVPSRLSMATFGTSPWEYMS